MDHFTQHTSGSYPPLNIQQTPYISIPNKRICKEKDSFNWEILYYFTEFLNKYPHDPKYYELAYLEFATQVHNDLQEIWHYHYDHIPPRITNRLKPLYDLYLQGELTEQANDQSFLGFDTWVKNEMFIHDKRHP